MAAAVTRDNRAMPDLTRRLACAALLLAPAWPARAANEARAWPANQPTPELNLADAAGKAWNLADARGKVAIVNFWASWCPPCRAEMPTLQSLAELYGDELRVLLVNFKERDSTVLRFAQAAALTLPMPLDRDGAAAARWGVRAYPSSFVIDRAGRVRWRVTGEVDWSSREAGQWIEPLLK